MGYLPCLVADQHDAGRSNLVIDYGVSMRSYFIIMLFAVIFGVISTGCVKLKESQYGKFTEDEVARMAFADSNSLCVTNLVLRELFSHEIYFPGIQTIIGVNNFYISLIDGISNDFRSVL